MFEAQAFLLKMTTDLEISDIALTEAIPWYLNAILGIDISDMDSIVYGSILWELQLKNASKIPGIFKWDPWIKD